MGYVPKHPRDRFWDKVEMGGSDDCWEWKGARHPTQGYGFIYAGRLYQRNKHWVKAHRLSWEIAHRRQVPEGRCILHHCDNPPCVNPVHLYLGSRADNANDRAERKRGKEHRQRGEDNDNAKLTEKDVRSIIEELRRLPRRSQWTIAREFGIGQAQVSRIMRRENWSHLWEK